ncbi:MAG TPA: HlyD family efflux transporter periplasmic adaptor subunit [bacterium]|nr:HlyD family efflux transporter periplasmic adaptor subunit [bacterium]HPQ65662.1 HlyD family efflux transporter periplasmic adaptor subunit [bacterium]
MRPSAPVVGRAAVLLFLPVVFGCGRGEKSAAEALPVRVFRVPSGAVSGRTYPARWEWGRVSDLSFPLGGRIEDIRVDMGARVEEGEELASLDSYPIRLKLEALDASGVEEGSPDRSPLLRQLEDCRIRAPFAGLVVSRPVQRGDRVSPGEMVLRVASPAGSVLVLNLPASAAEWIGPGSQALVRTGAAESRVLAGTVVSAAPIPGADGELEVKVRPEGMKTESAWEGAFSVTFLSAPGRGAAFVVPARAVVEGVRSGDDRVWVAREGRAHLQRVRAGPLVGDGREIFSGVVSGDLVILTFLDNLREGTPVKIIETRTRETPPPAPAPGSGS